MKVNIKICCINGCTVSLHLVAFSNFKDVGELKLSYIEVLNYALNYKNFHLEIETLKSIFKHNNYPKNFANEFIAKFLNK